MNVLGWDRGPSLNVSGVGDSQDSSDTDDEETLDSSLDGKPRGLVGLQNIGNTCYMNSAIQALSNTPPLTQYFLDCSAAVDLLTDDKKPGLSRSYQKLVKEIWHKKTRGYVVPRCILYGIRNVHPMFRGYHQHDTQEFLRCFMDQLHEELKEPIREEKSKSSGALKNCISQQPTKKTLKKLESYLHDESKLQHSKSKDKKCKREDRLNRKRTDQDHTVFNQIKSNERSSSTRSFDNIPSVSNNIQFQRIHTQSETTEGYPLVIHGHRRSASYCDPRRYYQLPQDVKDNSPSPSPRPDSPLEYMDRASSEKEMDDDDEEAYETCDSGVSDSTSMDGEDNFLMSKGLKRKSDMEVLERHSSESETGDDSSVPIVRYRSVISDIFDGRLLSSVQCLTCDRISTRVETFQDLSLPIPSRDHVAVLHNGGPSIPGSSSSQASSSSGRSAACSDAVYSAAASQEGWIWWLLGWLRSWLYGPAVTLQDCLAAFFSADELKGDNMYSCEKCNKLRVGVKFSKVLSLPEVLCVHLKRFRHELMFSTKIGAKVSFPLTGLDMRPYLHKDCTSEVTNYELVAIICHAGTAGGGHYTCVAQNRHSGRWFEFDDQCVTGLTPEQVMSCEAYVLFYEKVNPKMVELRQRAVQLLESATDHSDVKYYISKQWINRFNTYAEPGPIDNRDFLCQHGEVSPERAGIVERLTLVVPQFLWRFLYENFGGGPSCNNLHACMVCRLEIEQLQKRQKTEFQQFMILREQFYFSSEQDTPISVYAISMNWFKLWHAFARNQTQQPPPPIDNSEIIKTSMDKSAIPVIKKGSEYSQLSEDLWRFFHDIYGGGPEVILKSVPCVQSSDQSQEGYASNPSYSTISSQHTRQTEVSQYDQGSDSEEAYQVESHHVKSLSNVDLLNIPNKPDTVKASVKVTQSLQDVSVQNMQNPNVIQSTESQDEPMEYIVNGTNIPKENCNGRVTMKYRDMSSDDSEHQTFTNRSKRGVNKKSYRIIDDHLAKSSQSTDGSVISGSQREENSSIKDEVNNSHDAINGSPKTTDVTPFKNAKKHNKKVNRKLKRQQNVAAKNVVSQSQSEFATAPPMVANGGDRIAK